MTALLLRQGKGAGEVFEEQMVWDTCILIHVSQNPSFFWISFAYTEYIARLEYNTASSSAVT